MFNLNTVEGMENHIYRNKQQFKKAPHDLKTMEEFVKNGYFYKEGFTPCHNIIDINNTKEFRKETFKQYIQLIKNKKIYEINIFSPLRNISYRGVPKTDFEGCQFVYNYNTGKLVADCVNRGTWDFGKPGTMAHMLLDFMPWITYGNGENEEKAEDFIMTTYDENKYLKNKNSFKYNFVEDYNSLQKFYNEKIIEI